MCCLQMLLVEGVIAFMCQVLLVAIVAVTGVVGGKYYWWYVLLAVGIVFDRYFW